MWNSGWNISLENKQKIFVHISLNIPGVILPTASPNQAALCTWRTSNIDENVQENGGKQ